LRYKTQVALQDAGADGALYVKAQELMERWAAGAPKKRVAKPAAKVG
jgi:hypothetical protein